MVQILSRWTAGIEIASFSTVLYFKSRSEQSTNCRDCVKTRDTTGFSRVEVQFHARTRLLDFGDTTDFSRVEFQFPPFAVGCEPKLRLHATEVGGISRSSHINPSDKLSLHAAEAGGVPSFEHSLYRWWDSLSHQCAS